MNNPNKEDRIFTDKELEFRKGNLEFSLDDIFYAWDIENSNQLQIHITDYENWKKRHAEWCRNHQPLNRDKIVEEEKNKVIRELAEENRILSSDRVCLREENDFLKSELRKLKNQPQKAIDSSEKPLATREKKTLLKLLRAAIELDDRRKIDKRGLAGALARKTQLLYKDSPVSERTVEIKIREIIDLQD